MGTIASDRNFAIGFDGRLFHFVAGVMREGLPRRKNEGDVIGRREDRSVAISQGSRNLRLARRDKKSLFRGGPLMRVLSRQVDEKRGSGPGLIESLAGAEITSHESIRLVDLPVVAVDVLSLAASKIDTGPPI